MIFGEPGNHGRKALTGAARAMAKGDAARNAEAMRKVQLALNARGRGLTWEKVAEASGYSSGNGAMSAVRRYMTEMRQETRQNVEELRELEVYRLDRALLEITSIAYDRKLLPERRLVALEALRRNVESRAKLQNLYPTQQVEVVTISQIERRVAELSHQLGVAVPRELMELPAGDSDDDDGY